MTRRLTTLILGAAHGPDAARTADAASRFSDDVVIAAATDGGGYRGGLPDRTVLAHVDWSNDIGVTRAARATGASVVLVVGAGEGIVAPNPGELRQELLASGAPRAVRVGRRTEVRVYRPDRDPPIVVGRPTGQELVPSLHVIEALAAGPSVERSSGRRLVILDDLYPHLQSGFRVAEHDAHLRRWPTATVLSTGQSIPAVDRSATFGDLVASHRRLSPDVAPQVRFWDGLTELPRDSVAYLIFLNNAHQHLGALRRHDIPFVFTLYPGGGFRRGIRTPTGSSSRS